MGNSVGAIGWPTTPCSLAPGAVDRENGAHFDLVRSLCLLRLSVYNSVPLTGVHAGGLFTEDCGQDSYLVDSASSHMLVSKIKPCMSKYKQSIR